MRDNCLTATLDLLVDRGGYGAFRVSPHSRWGLHALHIGPEGLSHFTPGATLDNPSEALFGFDGVWWDRDLHDPKPPTVRAVVVSAWIFAITATFWAIRRRLRTPCQ